MLQSASGYCGAFSARSLPGQPRTRRTDVKQISLEEAQLLFDLGASVYWFSNWQDGWLRITGKRPGTFDDDNSTLWGVPEE